MYYLFDSSIILVFFIVRVKFLFLVFVRFIIQLKLEYIMKTHKIVLFAMSFMLALLSVSCSNSDTDELLNKKEFDELALKTKSNGPTYNMPYISSITKTPDGNRDYNLEMIWYKSFNATLPETHAEYSANGSEWSTLPGTYGKYYILTGRRSVGKQSQYPSGTVRFRIRDIRDIYMAEENGYHSSWSDTYEIDIVNSGVTPPPGTDPTTGVAEIVWSFEDYRGPDRDPKITETNLDCEIYVGRTIRVQTGYYEAGQQHRETVLIPNAQAGYHVGIRNQYGKMTEWSAGSGVLNSSLTTSIWIPVYIGKRN